MSSVLKVEIEDKENSKVGIYPKKDKLTEEYPKKTVLGEASQPKIYLNEPTSPEDTKLMERKRKMNKQSVEGFSLTLNFCWSMNIVLLKHPSIRKYLLSLTRWAGIESYFILWIVELYIRNHSFISKLLSDHHTSNLFILLIPFNQLFIEI